MKKMITFVLLAALVLALFGCGATGKDGKEQQTTAAQQAGTENSGTTTDTGLQIGYAKTDITPEEQVPLSGSAGRGNSTGMRDYLYATCVAISDGKDNTVLIFGMDIQNAYSPTVTWRDAVSKATGIPTEKIQICFTHTHSAPNTGSDDPSISRYNSMVSERMVKTAKKAIEDLSAAQASISTIETERMNFVRRYIMNDGSLCGDNWGTMASGIKSHETEADGELQIIRFTRENGEDVILANFQMHSNYTMGDTNVSSDVAGTFRDSLEKKSGVNVLYLNGASGNINPKSRIADENKAADYRQWGEMMADYAMTAMEDMKPVSINSLQNKQMMVEVPANHMFDHLYEQAAQINDYFKTTGDRSGADAMCAEAGISSVYHADSIVANKGRGQTVKMELDVYAIGDLSFIFAPVELFDTNGMQIKDATPSEMTFICGYSNQCQGYMPAKDAYANIGYEVATSCFGEGAAETVVEYYLTMLNELHG